MTHERIDIHQHITNQIISCIEAGAGDFRLPWHAGGTITSPTNIESKKHYRGVNILALWAAGAGNGYTSGQWGTYRQWANAGAQVRRDEKSTYIVFYKELHYASVDQTDPSENDAETRLFARATPVFFAEQVDGFEMPVPGQTKFDPIEAAEGLVSATQATIHHGGNRAYYRPKTDSIQLPFREAFIGRPTSTAQEAYYSTLLHELTHWTSPATRCDRQLGKRFGDHAYAMEELVAELGAAFLCSELGVTNEPRVDHAQYLASWLSVLKADRKAIFTAASAASKACAFLSTFRKAGGG